ncbi:hypothetical protein [Thermaerobacter sp. FW80]|uniref:hypothetical protein n=1 Tax=Thermaerobacter sp. FW80 TaxID=2546351 RepID=UPI001FAA468D|nr:hypothetical protein [Thermaerobacter sp. FW80]
MGVEVIGQPEKKYLTWQDIEQLVDRLLQQIRIEEFDALLVITRGAWSRPA